MVVEAVLPQMWDGGERTFSVFLSFIPLETTTALSRAWPSFFAASRHNVSPACRERQ
jgi:hypothetical protein